MGIKWNPFVPYIVNTNSARRVEFTERKSSHTGIELEQRPSQAPKECSVDYKVLLSGSHHSTMQSFELIFTLEFSHFRIFTGHFYR